MQAKRFQKRVYSTTDSPMKVLAALALRLFLLITAIGALGFFSLDF